MDGTDKSQPPLQLSFSSPLGPTWVPSLLPSRVQQALAQTPHAHPLQPRGLMDAFLPHRFTCPFVEKFSIDIETFYKTDAGENPNVFSLSPVEKNQLTIGNHPPRGCPPRKGRSPTEPCSGFPCPWAPGSALGFLAWQAPDWLLS